MGYLAKHMAVLHSDSTGNHRYSYTPTYCETPTTETNQVSVCAGNWPDLLSTRSEHHWSSQIEWEKNPTIIKTLWMSNTWQRSWYLLLKHQQIYYDSNPVLHWLRPDSRKIGVWFLGCRNNNIQGDWPCFSATCLCTYCH